MFCTHDFAGIDLTMPIIHVFTPYVYYIYHYICVSTGVLVGTPPLKVFSTIILCAHTKYISAMCIHTL